MNKKQLIVKEEYLKKLEDAASHNIEKYFDILSTIESELVTNDWMMLTRFDKLNSDLLIIPDFSAATTKKDINAIKRSNDIENSRRLYAALKDISLTEASDPRLWVYLTHVTFRDYMHARWLYNSNNSMTPGDLSKRIIKRFFLRSKNKSRSLVLNGLSRLWWGGYICHSHEAYGANTYEMLPLLFRSQDTYGSLMERSYSTNIFVMQNILHAIGEYIQNYTGKLSKDHIRDLAKHITLIGGSRVLDSIDKAAMQHLVHEFLHTYDSH